MGFDINIHDQWACESQGRIPDRTKEHLGTTDKGIVLYRRILLDAIEKNAAGEKPLMMLDEQKRARPHRPSRDRRHRRDGRLRTTDRKPTPTRRAVSAALGRHEQKES